MQTMRQYTYRKNLRHVQCGAERKQVGRFRFELSDGDLSARLGIGKGIRIGMNLGKTTI